MDHLPNEIVLNCFAQLPLGERINLMRVCQKWKRLARSPCLWKDTNLFMSQSYDTASAWGFIQMERGKTWYDNKSLKMDREDISWLVTRTRRSVVENWSIGVTEVANLILETIIEERAEEKALENMQKIVNLEELDLSSRFNY